MLSPLAERKVYSGKGVIRSLSIFTLLEHWQNSPSSMGKLCQNSVISMDKLCRNSHDSMEKTDPPLSSG